MVVTHDAIHRISTIIAIHGMLLRIMSSTVNIMPSIAPMTCSPMMIKNNVSSIFIGFKFD